MTIIDRIGKNDVSKIEQPLPLSEVHLYHTGDNLKWGRYYCHIHPPLSLSLWRCANCKTMNLRKYLGTSLGRVSRRPIVSDAAAIPPLWQRCCLREIEVPYNLELVMQKELPEWGRSQLQTASGIPASSCAPQLKEVSLPHDRSLNAEFSFFLVGSPYKDSRAQSLQLFTWIVVLTTDWSYVAQTFQEFFDHETFSSNQAKFSNDLKL